MKTEKIKYNGIKIQSDRVRTYLDQNVSISDLNTGPTEFTEQWIRALHKRGEDYRTLPTAIMEYYIEKTRTLTL